MRKLSELHLQTRNIRVYFYQLVEIFIKKNLARFCYTGDKESLNADVSLI